MVKRFDELSKEEKDRLAEAAARLGWTIGDPFLRVCTNRGRCDFDGIHLGILFLSGDLTSDTIRWAVTSLDYEVLSLSWGKPSAEQMDALGSAVEESPVQELHIWPSSAYEMHAEAVERWAVEGSTLLLSGVTTGGDRLVQSIIEQKFSNLRSLRVDIEPTSEWGTGAAEIMAVLDRMSNLKTVFVTHVNQVSSPTIRVQSHTSLKSLLLYSVQETAAVVAVDIDEMTSLEELTIDGFKFEEQSI